MKKLLICILVLFLSLTILPNQVKANTDRVTTESSLRVEESTRAKVLLKRLDVIHAMDKSTLSSSEKKSLRKEVRSIKQELKTLTGGIYLSVGAIIIIILLLIILL